MKEFLTSHIMLSAHLGIIALLCAGSAWYVSHSLNAITLVVEDSIAEQIETLATIANEIDTNDVDARIGSVIQDCPDRAEFEALLSRLGSLQNKELIKSQQLFHSCGMYFAERKALMVALLEREYDVLVRYVRLLDILDDTAEEHAMLASWNELTQLERDSSAVLTEITLIQGKIISLLIEDSSTSASQINQLVRQAQTLNETAAIKQSMIDELRIDLTPLP